MRTVGLAPSRTPLPVIADPLPVIARPRPGIAEEKREKDEKKRLVNILIISGYIFRHCKTLSQLRRKKKGKRRKKTAG
jgi:hypothetical protein